MREALGLFGRGFVIVLLTAMQVYQIAGHHYEGAFLTGAAISFTWWHNVSNSVSRTSRWSPVWYALGAGSGTCAGMFLMQWFYGT